MQRFMEELLVVVGEEESHPLTDLLDVVGLLISDYDEERAQEVPLATPREVLKLLIEQRLQQSDLRKEIGTQGVVSEILAGNRSINVRQAKALAKRFGISPAAFL